MADEKPLPSDVSAVPEQSTNPVLVDRRSDVAPDADRSVLSKMSLFNIGAAEEGLAAKSLDTTQKETLESKMSVEQEQDVLTAILAASDKETLRTRPKTPCPISSSRFPPRSASLLEEAALKGSFLKASDKKARKHIWKDKQDSPKSSRGIVITPRRTEEETGEKSIYTAVSSAGQSSASSKSDRKERRMPEIHPVYGEQQGHPTKDVVSTPPDSDSNRVRSEVMTATGRRERVCEEITSSPLKKRKEMPELKIPPVSNHREQVGQCTPPVLPAPKQDEIKADNEGETRVELPEKATETKVAAPQETDKAALEQLIQKSLLIPKKLQQKQQVHSAVLVDKAKERLVQEITSSSHSTTDSRTEPEVRGVSHEPEHSGKLVTARPLLKAKEAKANAAVQLVPVVPQIKKEADQRAQKSALVPGKIKDQRQSRHAVLIGREKERSVKAVTSSSHSTIDNMTEEALCAGYEKESEQLLTLPKTKESEESQTAQIVSRTPKAKEERNLSSEQLVQMAALVPKKVEEKRQDHHAALIGKESEQSVKEMVSTSHSTIENRSELEFYRGSLDKPKKEVVRSGPKTDQATQKIEELDLIRQQEAQESVLVPGKIEERQQSQHSVLLNEEKPPSVGELLSSLQNNIKSETEPEVLGASCAQESEHLVTARPLLMKKVSKAAPIAPIVPAVPQAKTGPGVNLEQLTQMSALVPGKVNETRQDQRAVLVSKEREQSVKEMSSSSHSSLDSSLEREIFGFSRKHEQLEQPERSLKAKESKAGQVSEKTPQDVTKAPCLVEESSVRTARGAEEIQQENLVEEAVPMATTPRTPHQRIVITPTSGEEIREQGQLGFVSQNEISAMSVSGTPQRFVGESPAVSDRQTQSVHVAVETPKSRVGHEPFLISDSSERQHESDLVAVNSHREKWYQSAKGTPRTGSQQEVSTPRSRRAEDSQEVVRAESPYPKSAEHSEGIRTAVEKPSPKPAEFSLASIFPSLFGQGTSSDEGSSAPDAAASRPRPVAQRPSPFTYPEQPARPKDPRRDVTRFRSEYANKFTLGSRHTVDFFRGSYDDAQREARSSVKLIVVFIHDPSLEESVRFINESLNSVEFGELVNDYNLLVWGVSNDSEEGKFVAYNLHVNKFPFLSLMCPRADNRFFSVRRITGFTPTEDLVTRLEKAIEIVRSDLKELREQRDKLLEDRRLMQEQEKAYRESAEKDKQKMLEAKKARQEKQEAEEREKKKQQEEIERRKLIADQREMLRQRQVEEQPVGRETVHMQVRFPCGTKFSRKFALDDSMEKLFTAILCHEACPDFFTVAAGFPRIQLDCAPEWYYIVLSEQLIAEGLSPTEFKPPLTFRAAGFSRPVGVFVNSYGS